jgi:hypothetical protein
MSSFDELSDLQDRNQQKAESIPFWKVDHDDEKELLAWLNLNFDLLKKASLGRHMRIKENIAYYRGMAYERGSRTDRERSFNDSSRRSVLRKLKMSVNSLHDMVEQNVSRETRYRPAVTFNPGGESDHDDLMASKVVEKVNDSVWYRENIDNLFQLHSRTTKITGESYFMIKWNPHKGPLHPDYVRKLFEMNQIKGNPNEMSEKEIEIHIKRGIKKFPKMSIKDQVTGETVKVDRPVRIGEEEYEIVLPLYILLQPKNSYDKCDWAFYYEYVHVEDLRADFSEKSSDIKSGSNLEYFDMESFDEKKLDSHVLKIHFYHKGTDKLDHGRYVCFTPDAILINEDNEYANLTATNGFPWVRRYDDLPPNHLHGIAVLEQAKPLQEKLNWLYSSLVRASMLSSHPKWVAPLNSVKSEAMGNDSTIMWYRGAVPPQLMQPNPGAPNSFKLIEIFSNEMQKIMGVFGISRGEPPAGVKAGVAMQFLNEQENERANSQIANHNSNIRDVAILTIFLAGIKYDESDKRLEKLLGLNDAKLAKYFDMANLSREWDVKAQTSSALPHQKGQRIQTIIDLRREFPGKVDDDEALEMIGFGQADKFISINTVNIRSAEAENDEILRAGKTSGPELWEEHIVHYRIHVRKLSESDMKDGTVPKAKVAAIKDHVATHEMLMMEIALKNPAYHLTIMQNFPAFPMFMPTSLPALPVMQATPSPEGVNPNIPQQPYPVPQQEMAAGVENKAPIGG